MRLGVRALLIIVVVVFMLPGLTAADEIFVRDILDNPQDYFNQQVNIQGTVTEAHQASDPNTRGFYLLMDASDKSIKIVANTVPELKLELSVTAIVQVEPGTQEPYLREVARRPLDDSLLERYTNGSAFPGKKNGFWVTVAILVVLIVIVLAILLIVIFKKTDEGETESEQHEVVDPNLTKQVNLDELEQEVGALKTRQVPTRLAELRVVNGKFAGKSFPMGFETRIGRIHGDITLEDASVSREHAVIAFVEKGYVLKNISKTNPAILNGERLEAPKSLKDGDEIVLGIIKLEFKML